jgi:hypothetical protein
MSTLATLIKYTHGLISTSNLHLQKVRLAVRTLWTDRHGSVHIFPCCCSTEDIIDLFLCRKGFFRHWGRDFARIRAGRTAEKGGSTLLTGCELYLQQRAVQRTEPHRSMSTRVAGIRAAGERQREIDSVVYYHLQLAPMERTGTEYSEYSDENVIFVAISRCLFC